MPVIEQQLRNGPTYITCPASNKNSQWFVLLLSILTFSTRGGRGQPADFKPASDCKGGQRRGFSGKNYSGGGKAYLRAARGEHDEFRCSPFVFLSGDLKRKNEAVSQPDTRAGAPLCESRNMSVPNSDKSIMELAAHLLRMRAR
jgi:hypothetical protein